MSKFHNSLLPSVFNARWLPTGDQRYLRMGCPYEISEEDINFLRKHNLLTVVDLREEKEYTVRPSPLEKEKDFTYYHLPVSGGDVYPITYDETMAAYALMVDAQLYKIVDTIMNAKTGVVYYCAAGKDRTGVVSAFILKKLGYDEDCIIKDYMVSKENIEALLEDLRKKHPDKPVRSIIPNPDYLLNALRKAKN